MWSSRKGWGLVGCLALAILLQPAQALASVHGGAYIGDSRNVTGG